MDAKRQEVAMNDTNPILPIISGIKLEIHSLAQSMSKMNKTNSKFLAEEWLTKEQVLTILQVCPRTLEYFKSSGKLAYSKIGRTVRFKTSDVEHLLIANYDPKAVLKNK